MVNLGNVIDGRKSREIPVASSDVYNRGMEWYARACWEEPDEAIRPSIGQYTCILEMMRCGSAYADLSLLAPHDVRTAKPRKFEGLMVGADDMPCRMEQRGPPDHPTYAECAAVHECGLIMAKLVSPSRIGQYLKMIAVFARDYPSCWALLYQQDDRWRFEQMSQLLRKEQAKHDRYAAKWG